MNAIVRGAPNPIVPDPEIGHGRFKILQRTDRRYVVHESEQGSGAFRFGPVFDSLVLAEWRLWHRVKSEERLGVRIGMVALVGDRPAEIVDFVAPAGETNLSRVEVFVRFRNGKVGQFPPYMIHPYCLHLITRGDR
jgi:hypothetical protein